MFNPSRYLEFARYLHEHKSYANIFNVSSGAFCLFLVTGPIFIALKNWVSPAVLLTVYIITVIIRFTCFLKEEKETSSILFDE